MGNLCIRVFNGRPLRIGYGSAPRENLYVNVKQGTLVGTECTGVIFRKTYYAFSGIPYAKPPVGDLRFQNPQPPDPWKGVYDATHERSSCSQVGAVVLWMKFVMGDEDCLYLNVYTPEPPSRIQKPKAVMVFIHGGGFVLGSGSKKLYSADYLMTRDVILVTLNYRLHALGFLNLGLPECPGNVGMKDQVLALKWIRDNISAFGGDPNNITIFGESAGSSSVHYHLLSPASKGLFHKAIMESGSALSPWGVTYNPTEQAFEIGKICGYVGNDPQQLVAFLKKVPTKNLTLAAAKMIFTYRFKYPARFNNMAPSIEVIQKDAFLLDWPLNLAKTATPVPTICGVNNNEGMLVFMGVMNSNLVQQLCEDFSIVLKHNFKIHPRLVEDVSIKLKKMYFGDKEIGMGTVSELVELYSHLIYLYTYDGLEFLINSKTPPFIYEFSYYGPLNFVTKFTNFMKRISIRGAAHGDELFYLFYPQLTLYYPHIDGGCLKMLENMTLMWTNFAKYGDPSSEIQWKPSTPQDPCYMNIDSDMKMKSGKFYGQKMESMKNLIQSAMEPNVQPYDIFDLMMLLGLLNTQTLIN